MHSNKRSNIPNAASSASKSTRLPRHFTTGITRCDKFTNTAQEEAPECKKCKEREVTFANFSTDNDSNIFVNYVKAINYINTCHHVINEFQKKVNVKTRGEIQMPDVPNFLDLYTSLTSRSKINCDSKETGINTNEESVSSDAEQKSPREVIKASICEKPTNNSLELKAKKHLLERYCNLDEPMASVMEEVCNLADIQNLQTIADGTKAKKVTKKSTVINRVQKHEDTDSECADSLVPLQYDCKSYANDGKQYKSSTILNLAKEMEKVCDNHSNSDCNIINKLQNLQKRQATHVEQTTDKSSIWTESSTRNASPKVSDHKVNLAENRKLSAPIVVGTIKQSNWCERNTMRLQLRSSKLSNSTLDESDPFQRHRQKQFHGGSEIGSKRTESCDYSRSKTAKSQHYVPYGGQRASNYHLYSSRDNLIAENRNQFVRPRPSSNYVSVSSSGKIADKAFSKVERKPLDFFTETRKIRAANECDERKRTYGLNEDDFREPAIRCEQYYADSECGDDHFRNNVN